MKNNFTRLPIFLINLKNNPERLSYSIEQLSKVGLTDYIIRKEACSIEKAKELKYEYITEEVEDNIEKKLVSCSILPTWGAVACAISHMEIWKMMVEDHIKYAIILEDDNEIYDIEKFKWAYNSTLKKIKKSEYLSYFISLCSNTRPENKTFIGNNIYNPSGFITGLSFYFISFNAAKDLLKKISTVRLQIDLEISNIYLYHNNLDKLKLQIYENSGVRQNKKFHSSVQFYFWEIEKIYSFFNIPYEMAEKIYFFLPNRNLIDIYPLFGDEY